MRVIAGTYGGRPLKSLPGDNTRPTGDKLKETMFNMIGPFFDGGQALDLYAGSGALGIEAVSRGIDVAVLVDKNRTAQKIIQENIQMTKEIEKFTALQTPSDLALDQLANSGEKFSLVFLDPPYAKQTIEKDITQMIKGEMLENEAIIVCETSRDVELPSELADLYIWKERTFGKTKLTIYYKGA